ncbi:MAG: carboxypeptidase regulatory-like domain-containing protein, partial [Acidobacteria bacterium]|nr:carboxypeptidase regulatory-like domain-containing protein [Acidobacteriota bacterium]
MLAKTRRASKVFAFAVKEKSQPISQNAFSWASLMLASLFLVCLSAAAVSAQSYQGALRGSLRDSTGNVLPNVTLMLVNTATNVSRTTVTNATG